jgi:hypothetical protein
MVLTRWNSAYKTFDSVKKSERAILLTLDFYADNGNANTKRLASKLKEDMYSDGFRHWLSLGQEVLGVVAIELDRMQSTHTRLSMILPAIYKIWATVGAGSREGEEMLYKLNARINKWDLDLLILSTALDPRYRLKLFNVQVLDEFKVLEIAESIFTKLFEREPNLRLPLLAYLTDFENFVSKVSYEECLKDNGKYINIYWNTAAKDKNNADLLKLMRHLECIVPNSAASERLFSTLGFIHSKSRNRLLPKTVLKLARIRAELLEEIRKDEAGTSMEATAYKLSKLSVDRSSDDDNETSPYNNNDGESCNEQLEESSNHDFNNEPSLTSAEINDEREIWIEEEEADKEVEEIAEILEAHELPEALSWEQEWEQYSLEQIFNVDVVAEEIDTW